VADGVIHQRNPPLMRLGGLLADMLKLYTPSWVMGMSALIERLSLDPITGRLLFPKMP
jgi:hypothetical protein